MNKDKTIYKYYYMNDKDNIIYKKTYNDIIKHPLYSNNYFSNYEEFLLFCEKDFSNQSGVNKLFTLPQIQFQQIISTKLCEYYLSIDTKGDPNPPITYFRYSWRR